MTALWRVGWEKTGAAHPEHQVEFESPNDGLRYLIGELSWLTGDLPPSDPVGGECIEAAYHISTRIPLPIGVTEETWVAGDYTYFLRRNEEEARRRRAL